MNRRQFKIYRCPECGRLSLTSSNRSTKCPYCSTVVHLTPSRIIAKFQNAREASEYLKRLKSRKAEFKTF
jgi:DNA-directed RNA polymerase subunit RPC12/RpoP